MSDTKFKIKYRVKPEYSGKAEFQNHLHWKTVAEFLSESAADIAIEAFENRVIGQVQPYEFKKIKKGFFIDEIQNN